MEKTVTTATKEKPAAKKAAGKSTGTKSASTTKASTTRTKTVPTEQKPAAKPLVPQPYGLHVLPIISFHVVGESAKTPFGKATLPGEDDKAIQLVFDDPLWFSKDDKSKIGIARPALSWVFETASKAKNTPSFNVLAPQKEALEHLSAYWTEAVGADNILEKLGATLNVPVAVAVEGGEPSLEPVTGMPIEDVIAHSTWLSPQVLPADGAENPTAIAVLNLTVRVSELKYDRAVKMVQKAMNKAGIRQALVSVVIHAQGLSDGQTELLADLLQREEVTSYTAAQLLVNRVSEDGTDGEGEDLLWVPSEEQIEMLLPRTALFAHIASLTLESA